MKGDQHFGLSSDPARQVQLLNRMLRALGDSHQVLMRAEDETVLLEDVCRIIVEDCGYAMVWIGYAEDDEDRTVRPVAYSGFEQGYLEELRITWAERERGLGPTGTAIRTGRACVCPNILTDPRFTPWRDEACERGYASSISLPLHRNEKAFGALSIYATEPDPFTEEEIRLLTELAGDLAYGIAALRLRSAHAASQESIRRSEERYRRFVEDDLSADFAVAPDGRILICNPAFVRLFGFTNRAEALASNMAQLHPDPGSWSEFLHRVETERVLERLECRRCRIDGRPIYIIENVVGIFDEQGHLTELKGYAFDDTERRRALRSLENANERLQEQAEELSAMNEELQSQTEELQSQTEELQSQTEELQVQTEELRVANEELLVSRSRTESARAEAEEEKRRLEAVMESLPVGVVLLDRDGGISRHNAAFEEVWGGPHPQTRSTRDYHAFQAWWAESGEEVSPDEWASSQALRLGKAVRGQLLKIRKFNGSEAFVLNGAAPIWGVSGRVHGSAVAIQDITDLRRMQEGLQELNEQLEMRVAERTETLERTIVQLEEEVDRRVEAEGRQREGSRMLEGFFRNTISPLAFMDRDFRFIRVNDAFARIFDREPDELLSRDYFELDPDQETRAIFARVVKTKEAFHAYAKPFFGARESEAESYWNSRITPVLDDWGEVQFLVFNLEDVTERERAFGELQERARQLQRLTMELSQAEDRERRRLAQILHDDLQQLLVGARLHVDLLAKKYTTESAEANDVLDRTRRLVNDAIEKSRNLSHELSPPFLSQGTLTEALGWLANQMHATYGLSVALDAEADADFRSEALRSFVYKATQEMLFNVIKHAKVPRAKVRLRRRKGSIRLVVADRGAGFDPARIKETSGFGLFSIRERAALLGGWTRCKSAPGRGCVFVLNIPSDNRVRKGLNIPDSPPARQPTKTK